MVLRDSLNAIAKIYKMILSISCQFIVLRMFLQLFIDATAPTGNEALEKIKQLKQIKQMFTRNKNIFEYSLEKGCANKLLVKYLHVE